MAGKTAHDNNSCIVNGQVSPSVTTEFTNIGILKYQFNFSTWPCKIVDVHLCKKYFKTLLCIKKPWRFILHKCIHRCDTLPIKQRTTETSI